MVKGKKWQTGGMMWHGKKLMPNVIKTDTIIWRASLVYLRNKL
jgi:hypothetical protein